jgi:hypothetical protein
MINRVSENHLKMTLERSKHFVLILNQSIKTSVTLTAEHVQGLNVLLALTTQ